MGRQRAISMAAIIIVCVLAWWAVAWAADVKPPEPCKAMVYQLRNLDAKMVIENLKPLLQNRKDIRIEAAPEGNRLVVYAVQKDIETLQAFLSLVDPTYLMFPEHVERAMIGEGLWRDRQMLQQRLGPLGRENPLLPVEPRGPTPPAR